MIYLQYDPMIINFAILADYFKQNSVYLYLVSSLSGIKAQKCGLIYPLISNNSRVGNIFHVTGPLWGESTGHRWIPSQRPVTRSSDVFFDLQLNKRLSKNIDAGDLRRHRAHYDVTVMRITKWCHSDAAKTLKKKMLWLIVSLLLYHHIYLNQCRLYSGFMPNFGLHYLAIHYFCMYACTTTKIWFHFRFPRSPETAILDGCKLEDSLDLAAES